MSESGYHQVLNHLTQGSSILLYSPAVRWAWLTILRKARRGEVHALTASSLALEAHIGIDEAIEALRVFTSPDPYSTTPDEDGRRLLAIDGRHAEYRLVNWSRYSDEIERANAAVRKARQRDRSRSVTESHDELRDVTTGLETVTDSRQETVDKRRKSKTGDGTASPRGCRIPDDFPDAEAREWAVRVAGIAAGSVDSVADEFRDYWIAVPGARGRKTDWLATWRNNCRNRPPKRGAKPAEQFQVSPEQQERLDQLAKRIKGKIHL